jgi:hypothetical protein
MLRRAIEQVRRQDDGWQQTLLALMQTVSDRGGVFTVKADGERAARRFTCLGSLDERRERHDADTVGEAAAWCLARLLLPPEVWQLDALARGTLGHAAGFESFYELDDPGARLGVYGRRFGQEIWFGPHGLSGDVEVRYADLRDVRVEGETLLLLGVETVRLPVHGRRGRFLDVYALHRFLRRAVAHSTVPNTMSGTGVIDA